MKTYIYIFYIHISIKEEGSFFNTNEFLLFFSSLTTKLWTEIFTFKMQTKYIEHLVHCNKHLSFQAECIWAVMVVELIALSPRSTGALWETRKRCAGQVRFWSKGMELDLTSLFILQWRGSVWKWYVPAGKWYVPNWQWHVSGQLIGRLDEWLDALMNGWTDDSTNDWTIRRTFLGRSRTLN